MHPSFAILQSKAKNLDRWVPGPNMSEIYNGTTYNAADPSSTSHKSGHGFQEHLLAASINGSVYRDTVGFANSTVASNFSFGVAENQESAYPFEGILGMGLSVPRSCPYLTCTAKM